MQRKIMAVKEAAEFLGVSSSTIYTGCKDGDIPHFRVRGKILFNRDVLEAWTRGELEGVERQVQNA